MSGETVCMSTSRLYGRLAYPKKRRINPHPLVRGPPDPTVMKTVTLLEWKVILRRRFLDLLLLEPSSSPFWVFKLWAGPFCSYRQKNVTKDQVTMALRASAAQGLTILICRMRVKLCIQWGCLSQKLRLVLHVSKGVFYDNRFLLSQISAWIHPWGLEFPKHIYEEYHFLLTLCKSIIFPFYQLAHTLTWKMPYPGSFWLSRQNHIAQSDSFLWENDPTPSD